MQDKKKKAPKKAPHGYPQQKITLPPSETDPMGSYTGVPLGDDKQPVQDADDL